VPATLTTPHLQLGSARQKLSEVTEDEAPCARPLVKVSLAEKSQRLAASVAREFLIAVACGRGPLDDLGRILIFAPAEPHGGWILRSRTA
jgi:hypothetical protein